MNRVPVVDGNGSREKPRKVVEAFNGGHTRKGGINEASVTPKPNFTPGSLKVKVKEDPGISLIYSADYDFQVVSVFNCGYKDAWERANTLHTEGKFRKYGIEHYDVMHFNDEDEMNTWIMLQVAQGRPDSKEKDDEQISRN